MKIEIMSGTVVLHEIEESRIERAEWSGKKLVAEDYFMNEPSSVRLSLVIDSWLWEKLESEIVKIKDGLWLRYPVKVYDSGIVSPVETLVLTGLICLTESVVKPVERRMEIVIYDYSALLSELDVKVRIYYPWAVGEGTNWDRFIINYQLPGEGENEAPEEDDTPNDDPQWFPYLHTIETSDRQVSSVLMALTTIWQECFQDNWDLNFNHSYESAGSGGTEVNNYIVRLDGEDSFFRALVLGCVQPAWAMLSGMVGPEHWYFWANHGFIREEDRYELYREYGILPQGDCDGFMVIRAGFCWSGENGLSAPDGWSGGEVTVHDGPYQYREWYRVFMLRGGECVWESGQRTRNGSGVRTGDKVGYVSLESGTLLNVSENSFYRSSANDYYGWSAEYQNNVMAYFYTMTYYVYYTGLMEGGSGYIGNRIFRMKSRPGEDGREQYIEQSCRDWLKTMLFIGDLSVWADETGVIQIVPRSPLGDIELPMESLEKISQKMLVYQPWDKTKLEEVINDRAEIDYLVAYYGGGRVLSHELELDFVVRGFDVDPQLRHRFPLNAQIWGVTALSSPGLYMIVGVERTSRRRLRIRAVKS